MGSTTWKVSARVDEKIELRTEGSIILLELGNHRANPIPAERVPPVGFELMSACPAFSLKTIDLRVVWLLRVRQGFGLDIDE